jgi:hypothetical protein
VVRSRAMVVVRGQQKKIKQAKCKHKPGRIQWLQGGGMDLTDVTQLVPLPQPRAPTPVRKCSALLIQQLLPTNGDNRSLLQDSGSGPNQTVKPALPLLGIGGPCLLQRRHCPHWETLSNPSYGGIPDWLRLLLPYLYLASPATASATVPATASHPVSSRMKQSPRSSAHWSRSNEPQAAALIRPLPRRWCRQWWRPTAAASATN